MHFQMNSMYVYVRTVQHVISQRISVARIDQNAQKKNLEMQKSCKLCLRAYAGINKWMNEWMGV